MHPIYFVEETPSSNTLLKDLSASQNLKEGTIIAARHQTAGKGQKGNQWESEKDKNLTFSMIIYPEMVAIENQFILSEIVSLAIKKTLDKYTPQISIKWPNDIYWKDKKICGILIENSLSYERIEKCIIGIGLNINQEHFISNAPNPVSLYQITQQTYDLKALLKEFHLHFGSYYNLLSNKYTENIHSEYMNALYRNNGLFPYKDKNSTFRAAITNVLPSGHLILKDEENKEKCYAFKEVSFII